MILGRMNTNSESKALLTVPVHVAIIMDGNGRWAISGGKSRLEGHRSGVDSVREVVRVASDVGIRYLTIYAFSTENWGRPVDEVDGIMDLISYTIIAEADRLCRAGVAMRFIGDRGGLSAELVSRMESVEAMEVQDLRMTLVIAINYSSRWEITQAVQRIVERTAIHDQGAEGAEIAQICEGDISRELSTAFMPDPDLLIRTSGEQRLSNFMLWQLSYTELYFTKVLWPDFTADEFIKALEQYALRDRRFGTL